MTPLSLHPENGRYFLFRGRPTVLITSAEHYGAVLNLDFDFAPYLQELQARHLNQTRAFSGAYREVPGSFGITGNMLAPKPERYCAPWPRTSTPGAADGLGKFDLTRWNDAYFQRLRQFVREAGRRGVVVELVLFCPFYDESQWNVSPMNAKNNVNGVGNMSRGEVYTRKHRTMLALHDALTRRLVEAVQEFDNVYFEICNEPYFGGVTPDWQRFIADTIVDQQRMRPSRHLIAQGIANGSAEIRDPHPAVSVFNFHYASPPDAVRVNYRLNRAIAFDETGFKGTDDAIYRRQAWEFLLAGGAVFSHLDYSFTADHERGTAYPLPPKQPGGGGPAFRAQMKTLHDFMDRLPFVRMQPDESAVAKSTLPAGATARVLAEPGKTFAGYLHAADGETTPSLALDLPAGRWRIEWTDPRTGEERRAKEPVVSAGGAIPLPASPFDGEAAFRMTKVG